jgi:hypothetical protein
MRTLRKCVLWLALVMPILVGGSIIPQNGYSGRPGEGTCRDCHPAKKLVEPDSSVVLGLPDAWQPGTTYQCTLVVHVAGANFWSFEMTTVDSASVQAGRVGITDPQHTLLDSLDHVLYFKNSIKGTWVGQNDSARWAFDYTAPDSGAGPVSFYWCGYFKNRANEEKYYVMQNCLVVPEASGE